MRSRSSLFLALILAASASAAQAQLVRRTIITTTTQTAPTQTSNVVGNDYCREFTQTFTIGGKTQKGYGTACLQPDGSWEIQSPAQLPPEESVAAAPPTRTTETIQYVTRGERVYVVPPEPFVAVSIGGGYWHGRGYGRGYDRGYNHRYDSGYDHGPHR